MVQSVSPAWTVYRTVLPEDSWAGAAGATSDAVPPDTVTVAADEGSGEACAGAARAIRFTTSTVTTAPSTILRTTGSVSRSERSRSARTQLAPCAIHSAPRTTRRRASDSVSQPQRTQAAVVTTYA